MTVLWHDRSHAPERLWGDFYIRLVQALKERNVWFASGAQVVDWFRKRRNVTFRVGTASNDSMSIEADPCSGEVSPQLIVRVYPSSTTAGEHKPIAQQVARSFIDVPWNGVGRVDVQSLLSVPAS